jgi:AcrR family transcriptional regulator
MTSNSVEVDAPGQRPTSPADPRAGYPHRVARLPQALQSSPVGRTRLSREELGERQRTRIIEAATEVFAKRGFQASTVDNIVAAAGIGVGSFYAHFESKDDCLAQVCGEIGAEVHAEITAAIGAEGGWAERLCGGLLAILRYSERRPLAARVALLEAQTGGPEALRRYGAMLEEIAEFLRKGRAIGELDPEPPPSYEEATAGGLVWLFQSRLVRGEIDDVEGLFGEMADVALEPYIGARDTRREIKKALTRTS